MNQYISLVFAEEVDKDDLEVFKRVLGCIGVSSYKDTVNLYFRSISRNTLFHLSLAVHEHLSRGHDLLLTAATIDSSASASNIYEALREEAAI